MLHATTAMAAAEIAEITERAKPQDAIKTAKIIETTQKLLEITTATPYLAEAIETTEETGETEETKDKKSEIGEINETNKPSKINKTNKISIANSENTVAPCKPNSFPVTPIATTTKELAVTAEASPEPNTVAKNPPTEEIKVADTVFLSTPAPSAAFEGFSGSVVSVVSLVSANPVDSSDPTDQAVHVNSTVAMLADEVTAIFAHWKNIMQHPKSKLDCKRSALIRKALRIGYSVQQLCDAITGCSITPHNIGQNDRGQRYDGLHVILRDADQIDRFIYNFHHPPRPVTKAHHRLQANILEVNDWLKGKLKHNK